MDSELDSRIQDVLVNFDLLRRDSKPVCVPFEVVPSEVLGAVYTEIRKITTSCSSTLTPITWLRLYRELQNEEVAVTISVAEAVLCFSAKVCKRQRELEKVCNGQPKKKPNIAVIGPAKSLVTGIANMTSNCYIVESCSACPSIYW